MLKVASSISGVPGVEETSGGIGLDGGSGGRLSVVETSSRPDYEKARSFYLKVGYHEGARARNFYAPGDDKIIYLKDMSGS